MLTGSGVKSLRRKDLDDQKIIAVGFQKTVFAHKATAGQTGIDLTLLTTPPELSALGFSQPATAQLTAANLLFYRKNLELVSSVRGRLNDFLSYTVGSSTRINFQGFTALQDEIFIGTIDYSAQTDIKVVDARAINATGTLTANTTDFNVGTPFKTGQYSTSQVGSVLVFLDGAIQFRNSGNSSTVLDGNYYEVDAGSGLGTITRFNVTDPLDRNVLVVSNGLLSERPDGSMMATIESVQGQVNNMATYVAAATGNTTTTVLGAAPSNVDLKAFGDRVLTLEQNRARIDLSNTWTAGQYIPGFTSGIVNPSGFIGETIVVTDTIFRNLGSTTDVYVDVPTMSLTLQPGKWRLTAQATAQLDVVTGTSGNGLIAAVALRSGASTLEAEQWACTANAQLGRAFGTSNLTHEVNITAATTYKISMRAVTISAAVTMTGIYCVGQSVATKLVAVRVP